jgi:RNA polymerase sigma-70 factor (ECF subfamily)
LSLLSKHNNKKPEVVQAELNRDIIEKSKRGSRKAQYELYRLYSRAMFNVCMRMMNNRVEAEDMLQEAFSEAFRRLDSFRYDSTFGAWLKRIMVNRCINEIKRKKADLEFFDDMAPFGDKMEEYEDSKKGLSVEQVKKAMEKLPKGSRMIFSLYLLEGYDHQEISQIMDISESNSKTQYMRAKQKMKEILKDHYHAT